MRKNTAEVMAKVQSEVLRELNAPLQRFPEQESHVASVDNLVTWSQLIPQFLTVPSTPMP